LSLRKPEITAAPLSVPGFRAAGVRCGIKTRGPDLALIAADAPCAAAGIFTRSTVVGAPVEWSRARVRAGRVRGVGTRASHHQGARRWRSSPFVSQ